jgi:hypothetical protein
MNINQHKGFKMLKKDYCHSASSANAFIDSPAYWVITKLYDFEGPVNARMCMGTAAEHAANEAMSDMHMDQSQVQKITEAKFDEETKNEFKDAPEREWAVDISMRFVQNLGEFGEVVSYQKETITKHDSLKYPIKTLTDFEFKDVIVDTKATAYLKRLKKGTLDPNWYPKAADVRQQLLYQLIRNKPTMLLYASRSDHEAIDMVDRDMSMLKQLIHAMQTIEHITSIAKTKEDIIRMFPLNMDNFRWGKEPDSPYKQFARELWTKAFDFSIK